MEYTVERDKIIVEQKISLADTFGCGQAFRFLPQGTGFLGVAGTYPLYAEEQGEALLLYTDEQAFLSHWAPYFDLEQNYDAIYDTFPNDDAMRTAMEAYQGMRILRQDPFETIITFIISANNNMGRIRSITEGICSAAGAPILYRGQTLHGYPTPEAFGRLSEKDLRHLGAGYRAPYIVRTVRKILDGFDLDAPFHLPYFEAKEKLIELEGVGPKVADCILLFAYGFLEAFPIDTWIKKVLRNTYGLGDMKDRQINTFIADYFGPYGGIAQQYLFHYARMYKVGA